LVYVKRSEKFVDMHDIPTGCEVLVDNMGDVKSKVRAIDDL
jgi:hypothetical protein